MQQLPTSREYCYEIFTKVDHYTDHSLLLIHKLNCFDGNARMWKAIFDIL